MYQLALSAEQQTLLREILEAKLKELSVETGRTDCSAFRQRLQERVKTLEEILDRLPVLEIRS